MATRRERVVLELEDNFTSDMARAAAATALLRRELDQLGRVNINVRTNVTQQFTDIHRSSTQASAAWLRSAARPTAPATASTS